MVSQISHCQTKATKPAIAIFPALIDSLRFKHRFTVGTLDLPGWRACLKVDAMALQAGPRKRGLRRDGHRQRDSVAGL